MAKVNFSNIAERYEKTSVIQKSAAEPLFALLDIKRNESVLDLGCGTGNLTSQMRKMTKGRVVGVDISEGMIQEAIKKCKNKGIEYYVKSAYDLGFDNDFDVIFCNSTFQWLKNVEIALNKINAALKPGGRIGIQAPATKNYCPNFIKAIDKVLNDKKIGEKFSFFQDPWYFLDNSDEYRKVFEKNDFQVAYSKIETIISKYTPNQVFEIFSSGAIAGYLNQDYYEIKIDASYIKAFKDIVKEEFARQADENRFVELIFKRIYLVAHIH